MIALNLRLCLMIIATNLSKPSNANPNPTHRGKVVVGTLAEEGPTITANEVANHTGDCGHIKCIQVVLVYLCHDMCAKTVGCMGTSYEAVGHTCCLEKCAKKHPNGSIMFTHKHFELNKEKPTSFKAKTLLTTKLGTPILSQNKSAQLQDLNRKSQDPGETLTSGEQWTKSQYFEEKSQELEKAEGSGEHSTKSQDPEEKLQEPQKAEGSGQKHVESRNLGKKSQGSEKPLNPVGKVHDGLGEKGETSEPVEKYLGQEKYEKILADKQRHFADLIIKGYTSKEHAFSNGVKDLLSTAEKLKNGGSYVDVSEGNSENNNTYKVKMKGSDKIFHGGVDQLLSSLRRIINEPAGWGNSTEGGDMKYLNITFSGHKSDRQFMGGVQKLLSAMEGILKESRKSLEPEKSARLQQQSVESWNLDPDEFLRSAGELTKSQDVEEESQEQESNNIKQLLTGLRQNSSEGPVYQVNNVNSFLTIFN